MDHPKRRLGRDLSRQELLYYREQGLRNSEIAKLLDVTPMTIWNYIGGDGKRGRPPKNRDNKPIDNTPNDMV